MSVSTVDDNSKMSLPSPSFLATTLAALWSTWNGHPVNICAEGSVRYHGIPRQDYWRGSYFAWVRTVLMKEMMIYVID